MLHLSLLSREGLIPGSQVPQLVFVDRGIYLGGPHGDVD